ncbi:DNA helicase [Malaciobacter molluscorum LMG 25693]|uniref:DNA helicase n=1 Tax=Malaciobacter molluscorum LMG 25693 TaxID=870501 RepID=A0A2G1DLN4_9BACT|nr:UvrD-helicase domain-containing protein [Malaciobacter molluscorum]AXX92034.1 putative DNA helicase [Malaciobacter molluscorum LMG 25693]PHO19266.1 DNA helicase [Malaciobacter molluscorum LMG 25693]
MHFTDEQLEIINSKDHSFKINAVAGSGKTTTLLEYAKQFPKLKILYLAYNKSLQISLEEKLHKLKISNMQIKTIHSLAYNKMQAWNFRLTHDLKMQTIAACIKEFENTRAYEPTANYLALIKDIVNFYCNSSLVNIDTKLLQNYKKYSNLDAKILKLLKLREDNILNHTKYILSCMKNNKIESTHDFYLKFFYLNKRISSNLGYDLILVDEAQDISDVMIAIVENQKCKRVYVGDSFQQIYSFRFAINALDKIKLPTYNLSKSFRFSNKLAKTIESNLNEIYEKNELKKLKIFGLENKVSKVGKNVVDYNKQFCVISRSSFALIKEVIKFLNQKKDYKIYFEGGYSSYSFMNQTVYSIFYLKQKKYDKITVDEIKEFISIEDLEEYAKDTKNQEYINIIKFINTYNDNIFDINKQIKENLTMNKNNADIIFTTAHKSKGMQYSQVVMCDDDFISNKQIVNKKNKFNNLKVNEELNIYYVAATRTIDALNMAELHLDYSGESTQINKITHPKKNKKKLPMRKLKQLQNEWLKNNNIKQY